MADLKSTYMGLELKNPLVVASCGLVSTVDGVRRAAAAGAGAIVLKSMFEEQLRAESEPTAEHLGIASHPEALDYFQAEIWMRVGPREYCTLIQACRETVEVPIIASINCTTSRWWTDYALDVEAAGADGIELNILVPGTDQALSSAEVEQVYLDVVGAVSRSVSIPVAAKIGTTFSSLANFSSKLVGAGAKALVLFNRFHRPDIDVESLTLKHASPFSEPSDLYDSLRWVGLLSGALPCDLAASTGLHEAEHVVKQLLAGARVVQLCSTLYKNGLDHLVAVRRDLESWMGRHGFSTVDEFRGLLAHRDAESPSVYERRQYIKHLVGIH